MTSLETRFFDGTETETRRHIQGNRVAVGHFYADGSVVVAFNPDNRFLDSKVEFKEYRGGDEVASARRLLDEAIDQTADFSAFFV